MTMTLVDFEKLGCQVAAQGPGYVCSYFTRVTMSIHSNEGTRAGDRHADAVNQLLRAMMGGRESVGETSTRRFLMTSEGWRMSME